MVFRTKLQRKQKMNTVNGGIANYSISSSINLSDGLLESDEDS